MWHFMMNTYAFLMPASPVSVLSESDVIQVSASNDHSLFLKSNGDVYACGRNIIGQLGDGTTTDRYTPVQVMDGHTISQVSAGHNFSLFFEN